jgi:hypothetical protein
MSSGARRPVARASAVTPATTVPYVAITAT